MIRWLSGLRRSVSRKDQGFAEKLLPVLLSTGMVFGLVLLSGQFMELLRAREALDQTARAFLLEMESEGYLSAEKSALLVRELTQMRGLKEVSISGTTSSPVGYGERIELVVEGNLVQRLRVQIPFLYAEDKTFKIPIRIRMISTAKH